MQIISQNMESSTFNPVQEGKRVIAIFGFCDIRKFSFCCSELKEDTIIFTNTIAQVVHNKVNDAGGSINKNMGDGFLAVWKVIEEKQEGLSQVFMVQKKEKLFVCLVYQVHGNQFQEKLNAYLVFQVDFQIPWNQMQRNVACVYIYRS